MLAITKLVLATALSLAASPIHAYELTVAWIGVQGARAYFTTTEGFQVLPNWPTYNCPNQLLYIDLTQPGGRDRLHLLMLASTLGRTIDRIDVTQPGGVGTLCYAHLISVRP
jgi:hypothetical protein